MNTQEILLDEGLKYFKFSKKLDRYINTVEGRMITTSMAKDQEEKLKLYILRLKKFSNDIKKIENEFSNKKLKKDEAKEALVKLKKDNAALISTIQDKNAFQKAFPFLMYIPSTLYFTNTILSLFGMSPLKIDLFKLFNNNTSQAGGGGALKTNQSMKQ